MANAWEYIGDDEVRYVLGQPGKNNLLVIGVNPSTATPDEPDPTIKKVMKITEDNGYDGWIMVNLYPQRSTNPKGMEREYLIVALPHKPCLEQASYEYPCLRVLQWRRQSVERNGLSGLA